MSEETTAIELPSSNELVMKTRMTFGMMLKMQEVDHLSERIALFIESWSFDRPVNAAGVEAMDLEDGIVLMEVFNEKVLPLFQSTMQRMSKSSPNGSMTMTSPTGTANGSKPSSRTTIVTAHGSRRSTRAVTARSGASVCVSNSEIRPCRPTSC